MMTMKTKLATLVSSCALLAFASSAWALPVVLDLTTASSSGIINGATFIQGTIGPTGTGVYEPFLRLQHNGTEEGFNTSASGVLDNKAGIWTRDLLAETIPTITVGGKQYREIRLDINEKNNAKGRYLSLDALEIYLEDVGGIGSKAGLTNLKYSMDAVQDYYVKLDYTLASGSGWDDMSVLLPETIFSDVSSNRYFYLYSRFGEHYSSDAGFEEWAADPVLASTSVPEPGALALLGLGLTALFAASRRRGGRV